jgi:predicted ATP-binding protein involved in virulence
VIATLIEMLPGVKAIHVGAEAIEIEGPGLGRIPLGALSDGYLTTAGWVLDMIARWAEDAKRRGIVLDGSFRERMTGVAIVDEIDLHLHPRWQRDVVTSVRGIFPRMSFVVTTHNPLTILGAQPGEIHVLTRDEMTGRVEVLQRDLPPGAGAERILTGEWFELASTLDDETLTLLEKHRQLLRAGKVDDPEAKQLAAELTERLGSYAATSIERLAQSAAAQVLDEEGRNLSPKDREEARAKIADLLRKSTTPAKDRRTKRRSS